MIGHHKLLTHAEITVKRHELDASVSEQVKADRKRLTELREKYRGVQEDELPPAVLIELQAVIRKYGWAMWHT